MHNGYTTLNTRLTLWYKDFYYGYMTLKTRLLVAFYKMKTMEQVVSYDQILGISDILKWNSKS